MNPALIKKHDSLSGFGVALSLHQQGDTLVGDHAALQASIRLAEQFKRLVVLSDHLKQVRRRLYAGPIPGLKFQGALRGLQRLGLEALEARVGTRS